jgi:hypothetical protein
MQLDVGSPMWERLQIQVSYNLLQLVFLFFESAPRALMVWSHLGYYEDYYISVRNILASGRPFAEPPHTINPLKFSSQFGLYGLIKSFLDKGQEQKETVSQEILDDSLVAAARGGHNQAITVLLATVPISMVYLQTGPLLYTARRRDAMQKLPAFYSKKAQM